jgi:hypothetical protein
LGGLGKKLQPLALPSLAAQTASAAGGLSDDMKAKIEAKRCQAWLGLGRRARHENPLYVLMFS